MTSAGIDAAGALRRAVENMLFDCGDAAPGARVLIVREAGAPGYYGPELPGLVTGAARQAGCAVTLFDIGFDPEATTLPDDLKAAMAEADVTVFLARIADQLRFHDFPPGCRAVISYALDGPTLASPFGHAPHRAFLEIKDAVDQALTGAAEVRITCPAGTNVNGHPARLPDDGADVGLRRFPMLVPQPIPGATFSGRVALPGFLVGTGSRYYDPFAVEFAGPVFALLREGQLDGFEGAPDDVQRAVAHYDDVSRRFGLKRNFVHSWHAGIHPACAFRGAASASYERWSGSAFGNPRLLHFHTCGEDAPGEICWNVVDPTVTADGVTFWQQGRLHIDRLPGGPDVLTRYPEVAQLYANPVRAIGL